MIATCFWGVAAFTVGVLIAFQLAIPQLNLDLEWTTFGRLRPLHTSAAIFAFGGTALIGSSLYIVQRTCHTRLFGGEPTACYVGHQPPADLLHRPPVIQDSDWHWSINEQASVSVMQTERGQAQSPLLVVVVANEFLLGPSAPAGEPSAPGPQVVWATGLATRPADQTPAAPVQWNGQAVAQVHGTPPTPAAPRVVLLLTAVALLVAGGAAAVIFRMLRAGIGRGMRLLDVLARAPLPDRSVEAPQQGLEVDELSHCFEAMSALRQQLRSLQAKLVDVEQQSAGDRAALQQLQREAQIGLWETDLRSEQIRWSSQTYDIFGLPVGDEVTLERLQQFIPPADKNRFAALQSRAVRGLAALDVIHHIVRPDGQVRVVHERGQAVSDATGTPVALRGTVMDVTEAYLAQTRADLLTQTALASNSMIAICEGLPGEETGQVSLQNPAFSALFGIPADSPTTPWKQLWGEGDVHLGDAVGPLKQALAEGRVYETELECARAGNAPLALYLQAVPLPAGSAGGISPRWSLLLHDRSKQRDAEQALRREKQRYELLFQRLPLPMWTYDPASLKIVDVNQQAIYDYGYTAEQFRTMTLDDLRPAQDRSDLRAAVDQASGLVRDSRRWRHLKADGSVIRVEVHGVDVNIDGRALRIVCPVDRSAEEATREQLEALNGRLEVEVNERSQALACSEQRYRTLCEASPQIIWQTTAGGLATYMNPAWYAFFGVRREEALGVGWMSVMLEEDRIRSEAAFRSARENKSTMKVRRRVFDKHGAIRHLLGVASPLLMEDGNIQGWIGVDTDITDLVLQGEQLDAANNELEAFVYAVSHDLRAPVDIVRGFADGILAGRIGQIDDTARKYIQRIAVNARRMNAVIEDLLKLSRLGQQALDIQRIDLSALIETLLLELRERHPERPLEIVEDVDETLVLHADAGLLRLALGNLLDNAVKFSATRAVSQLTVQAQSVEGQAVIRIQDNGIGFPPAYAHKLFKPFQRLHTQRTVPGSGIGLAIVERIARRHAGRVEAANREGEGASFTLLLPLQPVLHSPLDPAKDIS